MSASLVCEPITRVTPGTLFGLPRNFLGNRFIYAVISPRAKGLILGVNFNPDGRCNFDCCYCEVDRSKLMLNQALDIEVMAVELEKTLKWARSNAILTDPLFTRIPSSLLKLRHVTLSGDGEPTLCSGFEEAVEAVAHVRARAGEFFKLALITNATGLDSDHVQRGLRYFTKEDEIWVKLDAGTDEYARKVNHPGVHLVRVLANILFVARKRPVMVQSLFLTIDGVGPAPEEIDAYVGRLSDLKSAGAQIALVQIYSAARPTAQSGCGHLPLKTLSGIARLVSERTGLRAEVF